MDDATARAVAYVAGRLVTDRPSGGVIDRLDGTYTGFTGDVGADRVAVFDQVSACWVLGRRQDAGPLWLFSQQTAQYLSLAVDGHHAFSGHDQATHHGFEVLAETSGCVEVIDHQDGRWRRYRLPEARLLVG